MGNSFSRILLAAKLSVLVLFVFLRTGKIQFGYSGGKIQRLHISQSLELAMREYQLKTTGIECLCAHKMFICLQYDDILRLAFRR